MKNAMKGTTPKPPHPPPPKPVEPPSGPSVSGGPAIVTSTPSGGLRCAPSYQYTNYKQADGDWAPQAVHPWYASFAATGCHIVAWTIAAGYYGHSYDPPGLRDAINAIPDGWQSTKTHPTSKELVKLAKGGTYHRLYGKAAGGKHNPQMVEVVRKHFCVEKNGAPMIGHVDYEIEKQDNDKGNHYVTIIGIQDGEPIVLDPGSADGPKSRDSDVSLPMNKKVKTGVLLNDINREKKRGHYYLAGLEYID
jgi:hypothetical protein